MTYIDTHQKKHSFLLDFPYRKEELIRVLRLKHASKGKAVCYTLIDKGEYFLIYASIELDIQYKDYLLTVEKGVIGIDINNDHIALSELDDKGNLMYIKQIDYNLDRKTKYQRTWIIENIVKEVLDICVEKKKPLVIEELDFEKKKNEFKIYQKNKRYHQMLSEFSYRKIIEKLYSRAYKTYIGIIEVNPAYTSVIGGLKYARKKGISVHIAASYVIGRRGMGYKERLPRKEYSNINQPLLRRWHDYHQLVS